MENSPSNLCKHLINKVSIQVVAVHVNVVTVYVQN